MLPDVLEILHKILCAGDGYFFSFTDEETKTQRGEVTCRRSHSLKMAEWGLEPKYVH